MTKKIIKGSKSKVWIDDMGIAHTEYLDKSEITLKQAIEDMEMMNELCQGRKVACIVDLKGVKSVNKEARDYFSSDITDGSFSAVAMIVDSPLNRLIANFFLEINKPSMPIKLFSEEKKAVEWLNKFKGR